MANKKDQAPIVETRVVVLYHSTTPEGAAAILASGFKDQTGTHVTGQEYAGVWLISDPLDQKYSCDGSIVLRVDFDVEQEVLDAYVGVAECAGEARAALDTEESLRAKRPTCREWLIPAEFLNARAKASYHGTMHRVTVKGQESEFIASMVPPESVSVRQERQCFLYVAAEHPKIRLADALYANAYALARRLPESDHKPPFTPEVIARREELARAVHQWAQQFHLDRHWVISGAYLAFRTWNRRRGHDFGNPFTWQSFYVEPPEFEWPNWLPGTTGRGVELKEAQYRTFAKKAFSIALEKYISDVKAVKALEKSKRSRDDRPVTERYEWAALRVCLRWKFDRIAEEYSVGSPQAVQESVSSVCARIGLSS